MRAALAAIACAALLASTAQAQLPDSVSRSAGARYYGDFEPRQAKSLDDLPAQVRQRLVRHLQMRLGEDIYKQLSFEGGDIVSREQRSATQADYRREVPAYRLNFGLHRPMVGIPLFVAAIELRADGSAIDEIELPCFSCHPEKRILVDMQAAAATAVANGMSASAMSVGVDYDRDADSIVWVFTQGINTGKSKVALADRLLVDAHSGALLRRETVSAR